MTRLIECLSCGSQQTFEPGQVKRTCTSCEVELPIPARIDSAVAENPAERPTLRPPPRPAATCDRCSAIFSGPSKRAQCACGSVARPLTTPPECMEADGILPLHITQVAALRAIGETLEQLPEQGSVGSPELIFVPWWVLSWSVRARFEGKRGISETRNDRRVMIWSDWSGEVERPWPMVERSASTLLPTEVAQRLSPWDWPFVEPFTPRAIEDALCEHTTVSPQRAMASFDAEIKREVRDQIIEHIGGDGQRISSTDLRMLDARHRVVLVPLWIARLSKGQLVAVNGRTGEVVIEGLAALQVTDDDTLERFGGGSTRQLIVIVGLMLLTPLLFVLCQ